MIYEEMQVMGQSGDGEHLCISEHECSTRLIGMYARILDGVRKDSIGLIVDVRDKFGECDLQIHIPTKRKFWMPKSQLEILIDHKGGCHLVTHFIKKEVKDIVGRPVEPGKTVCFPRVVKNSLDLVIGVVSEITDNGIVYIEPRITSGTFPNKDKVRIGKPESLIVIDDGVNVVLSKINTPSQK